MALPVVVFNKTIINTPRYNSPFGGFKTLTKNWLKNIQTGADGFDFDFIITLDEFYGIPITKMQSIEFSLYTQTLPNISISFYDTQKQSIWISSPKQTHSINMGMNVNTQARILELHMQILPTVNFSLTQLSMSINNYSIPTDYMQWN